MQELQNSSQPKALLHEELKLHFSITFDFHSDDRFSLLCIRKFGLFSLLLWSWVLYILIALSSLFLLLLLLYLCCRLFADEHPTQSVMAAIRHAAAMIFLMFDFLSILRDCSLAITVLGSYPPEIRFLSVFALHPWYPSQSLMILKLMIHFMFFDQSDKIFCFIDHRIISFVKL